MVLKYRALHTELVTDKKYQKLLLRIAENVRELREKAKLTQEDMSDFGFDYRFYQRIESGKHSMSLYTLLKLADAFKVDVADLLEK